MQISLKCAAYADWQTDLLVLIGDTSNYLFDITDDELNSKVGQLQSDYAEGILDEEYFFEPRHNEAIGGVLFFSTASASSKGISLWENIKIYVYKALKYAVKSHRSRVSIALNGPQGKEFVDKVAEGALMATWNFNRYKKDAHDKFADIEVELMVSSVEDCQEALERGKTLAEAVNFTRNLIAEPADVITPAVLAGIAEKLAQENGYEYEIWDQQRLLDEGYNGILKVGAGSSYAPCMFSVTYTPAEPCPHHLVMLGKGLTFDSGGISIKPAAKMHEMKGDMAGAAAVLGAMKALAVLKPQIKVTALVTAAENMPDARAQRPGDIIVYKNGKSVHVENTDAEGRLALADGLIRAGEIGATHVIDIATLTGGCWRALGESFTGIMGSNRALINAITQAGGSQGESFWKLPLPLEYKEMLKSPYADMTNSAGPVAAAITAGLFLKEFAPEDAAWAHLDIAGTSWREKAWKYYPAGPIGVGVRTLTELAWHWNEYIH